LLPFKLTGSQKRVLREIGADLRSDRPMNRLLQGDVGSGKTVVALLTMLVAVDNGYQAALMAPTEILAEQHQRTIGKILEADDTSPGSVLLTGSQRAAPRRRALELICSGEARIVIGTHALFEEEVVFHRLGLVVVDEQHRFGVLQRAALAEKGSRPDVLVMTATPIPRSLALTLYGDLDLSVIDELPPGRSPVRTVVRSEVDREAVYRGIRREIDRGHQAYVVVPLVAETAKSDLKAATAFAESLRKGPFRGLSVGMVHGRMKGSEKDTVMQTFAAGEHQALVATTVIEVGVDVPNATVMIVEHAERFGLSQLHQLRGRVGRGSKRSYCALMVGDEQHGPEARERLTVMEQTTDGFRIAERDLEIRGPGAVFGTQQHGLSDLQFLATVLRAPALLEAARLEAQGMVAGSTKGRRRATEILDSLSAKWQRRLDLARVG
jgi:ATP-dependent DNA helicase RecG